LAHEVIRKIPEETKAKATKTIIIFLIIPFLPPDFISYCS